MTAGITDERLAELMPPVPEGVTVNFYGNISTAQTGYGTWSVTVQFDVNKSTVRLSFTTHDESLVRGVYSDVDETYTDSVDAAVSMAIDANEGELIDIINA